MFGLEAGVNVANALTPGSGVSEQDVIYAVVQREWDFHKSGVWLRFNFLQPSCQSTVGQNTEPYYVCGQRHFSICTMTWSNKPDKELLI